MHKTTKGPGIQLGMQGAGQYMIQFHLGAKALSSKVSKRSSILQMRKPRQ